MRGCLGVIVACMLILEIEGCWRSSSAKVTTTTTTTTTIAPIPVDEGIMKADNVGLTDAARRASASNVATAKLKKFSEELFKADTNSLGSQVWVNEQNPTKSSDRVDKAPQPLISVDETLLEDGTFRPFKALLDNYDPKVNIVENDSKHELSEQTTFLRAVMATNVMKKLETFLKQNGLLRESLESALKRMWFTPYSRSRGRLGSSGFEHVFAGELKDGKVSGFHNWVFFLKEEKENDLNYMGYIKQIDLGNKGKVLKMRFNWLDYSKDFGSMFIGTSPELEMALYTLCFYTRPNKGCSLKLNGKNVRVKVYVQSYKGKSLIGSAYPDIY